MLKALKKFSSVKYLSFYFFSSFSSAQKRVKEQQLTPKDFSRLDIRIGDILQSDLIPQLAGHYCKKIRVQLNPNTVISVASETRNHIKQQNIIGKVAVIVNINPQNMVTCKSAGNVLYAYNQDKSVAEMIVPDGQIGDRIFLQHLEHLFPGGKTIQPPLDLQGKLIQKLLRDLKTDAQGFVVWKDRKLMTKTGFLKSNLKSSLVL